MKKIFVLLFLSFALFINNVDASEIDHFSVMADEEITIDDNYNASVVAASSNIDIEGNVDGIGVFAASEIEQNGTLEYGVLAASSTVISGETLKDTFSASSSFKSLENSKFNRDVYVVATSATLDGEFNRNVNVYASKVTIDGKIKGNVNIIASEIIINEGASIKGTLSYNKDANYKSSCNDINKIKKTDETLNDDISYADTVYSKVWSTLCLMLVFGVLVLLLPKVFVKINTNCENMKTSEYITLMGRGILVFLLLPLISVLLLFTVIGIPLAIILFVIYFLALYLSTIFVAYLIGQKVCNKIFKDNNSKLLYGIAGLFIILILEIIPIISFITQVIVLFGGLGIIFDLIKSTRK